MIFPDVNVCLLALRPDGAERGPETAAWFEEALNGTEPVGLSELVLSSMVRIVTNHRVFRDPTSPENAVAFADALLAAPAVRVVRPGARHWRHFGDLVSSQRLRANDVPDAYLASLAIESGATLVSWDRGFARFDRLRWRCPL